jgi:predicted DNA-binding transcriptional regulator AlpA
MTSTPSRSAPTTPLLSRDVARALNVSTERLYALIRSGRLPEPARDSSGRYCWLPEEVDRARAALQVDRRRREHRKGVAHAQA